jgi:putative aldouronate transport system substrate-binding protein
MIYYGAFHGYPWMRYIFKEGTMPRNAIVVVVLLALAIAPVFAGGQQESAPTPDETVTISVMQSVNVNYPFQEDWVIYEEMERIANVELDLQLVPDSDFVTKKRLVVASGDLPDMLQRVASNDTAEYSQWATEGAFLPVSDYIAQLPHFQELVEEWNFEPEMQQLTIADGKYYMLPQMYETPWQKIGWWMRGDILEKHGLPVPETLDELYDTLVAVRDLEPEMLPLSATFQQSVVFMLLGPLFGTQAGWGGGPMMYDARADKWEATMISEEFRAMLAYVKRLWDADLIDQELFVADNSQINNKVNTGQVFMTINWSPSMLQRNLLLQENSGNEEAKWITVLPFSGGTGKAAVPAPPRVTWGTVFPRDLADDPRLPRILEFADWSGYSEEGIAINLYGREGETFEMVNGEPRYLEEHYSNGIPNLQELKKDYGVDTNGWNQALPLSFLTVSLSEEQQDYYAELAAGDMYTPPNPMVTFTPDQKEDAKLLETPLNDYRNEMILAFVIGDLSLQSDWDDYVATAKDMGVDELIEIYDEAWSNQN